MNKMIQELQAVRIISKDPFFIKDIKNPTEKLQLWAVMHNVQVIQHIENPALEVQKYAVRQSDKVITYLKNPVYEVQEVAISAHPSAIKYMEEPCEQLQLIAVRKESLHIISIKKPTKKVVLEAIRNFTWSFGFHQSLSKTDEPLFDSFFHETEEKLLTVIPDYKKELENFVHFKGFLMYLNKFHKNWVPGVISALSPLTKEQKEFWNRMRLRILY